MFYQTQLYKVCSWAWKHTYEISQGHTVCNRMPEVNPNSRKQVCLPATFWVSPSVTKSGNIRPVQTCMETEGEDSNGVCFLIWLHPAVRASNVLNIKSTIKVKLLSTHIQHRPVIYLRIKSLLKQTKLLSCEDFGI